MVNKVTLIGNLGKDPEVRRLENGVSVARFSLATNENYKDKAGEWQTQTEWHDVVVWRNLAERAETSLKKGMMVYVEGKLSTRTWQDQEGNNRRTTEVVANYYRPLVTERKSGDYDQGFSSISAADEPSLKGTASSSQPLNDAPPPSMDDDLPF